MSTPTQLRPLFAGLIDDAAVFPPGSYPLAVALERRKARTGTPDAAYVGAFLLPPPLVAATLPQPEPLRITVIGRPGKPQADVIAAATAVAEHNWHALGGVQIGHNPRWRDVLALGVPTSIEVPAGPEGFALLDDLAGDDQVRAKLRTGATQTTPVPSAEQLGAFILGCRDRSLGFKLTGGMHRAVTWDGEDSDPHQFGFVNVLVAVAASLDGADLGDLAAILDERHPEAVAEQARAIPEARVEQVRDLFQSYGCCDVDDPIRDLRQLHLIEETDNS